MTRHGWNGVLLTPLLTLLLVFAAALAPAVSAAAEADLYDLMRQRLELMKDVAAHKWRSGLPIEDRGQEALVIEQAVADALRHGLTVGSSRTFFEAQIEAAKEIQRYWFDQWERGPGPAAAPDLDREVRPALLRLGSAIVAAAASVTSHRTGTVRWDPSALDVTGLSSAGRAALVAAANDLQPYPNRLQQILDSGVLRVGTTGDYAPFSHRDDGAADFGGVDIDLARSLADSLGVALAFVHTSWPELVADLSAGRYDVAMSGVSRTLERQKYGYLSVPYYVAGKTPIARCDAAHRYGSLDAIDRPGVRVVVNPGGTNQKFVDAHIRRADKLVHEDNRTIFHVLLEGRADVMITDRVEVELQAALHDGQLCATMRDDLSYQDKAYLLPQDEVWRSYVDTWLQLALADGTVAAALAGHGVRARPPGGP
jgi:cyclohexadienyl dehydratase